MKINDGAQDAYKELIPPNSISYEETHLGVCSFAVLFSILAHQKNAAQDKKRINDKKIKNGDGEDNKRNKTAVLK